jgi:hypothetical protein
MSTDLKTTVISALDAILALGELPECVGSYKDKPTSYMSADRRGTGYLADHITTDDSYEYRVNGAGLKLYSHSALGKVSIRIGGDQRDSYPTFVQRANALLRERGLQRA